MCMSEIGELVLFSLIVGMVATLYGLALWGMYKIIKGK